MPVKLQLSSLSRYGFFCLFLSQLINFLTKTKDDFGCPIFPRIMKKMKHSDSLQKTACTFEEVIAVILKQGVIITQWRDLKLYQF